MGAALRIWRFGMRTWQTPGLPYKGHQSSTPHWPLPSRSHKHSNWKSVALHPPWLIYILKKKILKNHIVFPILTSISSCFQVLHFPGFFFLDCWVLPSSSILYRWHVCMWIFVLENKYSMYCLQWVTTVLLITDRITIELFELEEVI